MGVEPKILVPQNGWFIRENPIKMDELEVFPLFLENPHVQDQYTFAQSEQLSRGGFVLQELNFFLEQKRSFWEPY